MMARRSILTLRCRHAATVTASGREFLQFDYLQANLGLVELAFSLSGFVVSFK